MNRERVESLSAQTVTDALGTVDLPDDEMVHFIASIQKRHASVLRVRRDRTDATLPFETKSIDWYSLGHRLANASDRPSRHLLYAAGDYYLQDAGSLLALAACGADGDGLSELMVCDLCAAPGGKASGLLEAIGDSGFLLANEPIRSRIAPLAFNLARTGSDRYAISCLDPDQLAKSLPGQFDLVLVDAPCSGQALMGRGKQSTAAMSPKQIQHSAARQERILDAAVELLRPGGRLIYSTCTFAFAENEAQIERLSKSGAVVPSPVDKLADYASGNGPVQSTYRLWPHRHDCAGSFAASMMMPGDASGESRSLGSPIKSKKKKDREKDITRLLKTIPLSDWFDGPVLRDRMKVTDSVIYAWPNDVPSWVTQIAVDGPELVHRTGQTWKPAHAAAIRCGSTCKGKCWIDVDASTAAQFLSGGTIPCQNKGWHVVRYLNRPLGWVKASGGIGKNQLPAAARSRGALDH